ncbi:MAG: hypothetical protein GWP08_04785 [Nitrospiraceae bacterium]|nr:hypothetical protein [Nitrospiraceae bacterium]
MKRAGIAMLAVLAFAGCVSAPGIRYYTLDMRASGQVAGAVNVRVERLREVESLARKEILIQRTPTQIEYYAVDEWAAAPGELIGQKLEAELGSVDEGAPVILTTGMILDFEQVDTANGADATVRLKLAFHREGESRYDRPLAEKVYEVTRTADSATPGAVVEALSRCLEDIAVQIAKDVRAF